MTISKVFFPINSGTGTCRFALYADAGDTPLGGTKAWDSGNIGAATITSATVNYVAEPGLHWFASTFSTNLIQTVRGWTTAMATAPTHGTFSYRAGSLASNTIALPSSAPGFTPSVNVPFFWTLTVS